MKTRFMYIATILLLLVAGCKSKSAVPAIEGINLDPPSPVAADSDVHVTASTAGSDLTYSWSVTSGVLRKAEFRSAQGTLPKIAVTPAAIDDFGQVLDTLDLPYQEEDLDILSSASDLKDFDVIFVNSSDQISATASELVLRSWVSSGGSLYISGRGAELVDNLWPGKITFAQPVPYIGLANGPSQHVAARVVDSSTQASIGKTNVSLHYPYAGWPPILGVDASVRTLVTADTSEIVPASAITNLPFGQDFTSMPVAVSFTQGKGNVLYTNFHVVSDLNADERTVLGQLAAIVMSAPLAVMNHQLVDFGGYAPTYDFVGFLDKGGQKSLSLGLTSFDDIFFALDASTGQFRLAIDGPGSSDTDTTGIPPMTAAFPLAAHGTWAVTVECTDDGSAKTIPFMLTLGTRIAAQQLVTTVPEAIWHAPSKAGAYDLTLKIVDAAGRTDEKAVEVVVQ